MPVPYLACMVLTAHFYHLPPRVLPSIQAVEGGRVGTVSADADGSADLGIMQINTRWIRPIAAATHASAAATAARLIHDPCFNIAAGGAILRAYLTETGGNLMLAIGDYHSHTLPLNREYQARVRISAAQLFSRGRVPG